MNHKHLDRLVYLINFQGKWMMSLCVIKQEKERETGAHSFKNRNVLAVLLNKYDCIRNVAVIIIFPYLLLFFFHCHCSNDKKEL